MRQSRVIALRIEEDFEHRHLDVIRRQPVIGGIAAVEDTRTQSFEEAIRVLDPLIGIISAFAARVIVCGQIQFLASSGRKSRSASR